MNLENKLFREHDKKGIKLFGKRRWYQANIGWSQDDLSICSKAYGLRPGVKTKLLSSSIDLRGNVTHEVNDYN